jgi:DnaA family protein
VRQLPLSVRLRDSARFDSFVTGSNREAVGRLAGRVGANSRVTWIWGRRGTGKTHLLQAACAAAAERGEAASYLDPASGAQPDWLEGCETLDLVTIDSLESVAGDVRWNAAIFRLHTLMQDTATRLCVASGPPPAGIEFALPDLRSRLLAGAVYQLQELDDEGQAEALQRRAERRGLELSGDGARYLLHRLPRDMHALCAALDRLDEAALAAQRRLTVPFLRQALDRQVPAVSEGLDGEHVARR